MKNCLIYALVKYFSLGGKVSLVVSRSLYGWFPHFSVIAELDSGQIVKMEYVPDHPRRRLFPPLLFKGHEVITIYKPLARSRKGIT